jgi:lysine decarboxylase
MSKDEPRILHQAQAPLVDRIQGLSQQRGHPFYAPGHKGGKGMPEPLSGLLGKAVGAADLPELPELDNLFAAEGVIEQAQCLAAVAFGAQQTWFLVNGSSCGIIAAILATCNPGDKLIVPRNLHQSAIAGLIQSGAIPVYIEPSYDADWDLALGICPSDLEATLQQHPDVKAVFLLHPTYHGICGDIGELIAVSHRHGLSVLVDEAHGAHFAFHGQLPPSALSLGADLVVQSTHKVLGSLTQSSMLHVQGHSIDRDRLSQALQWVQSSSPSYLLLASLDAARWQMATQGKALLSRTIALAQLAREQLRLISGLSVLELPQSRLGFHYLDPTRLTIRVDSLGRSGFEVDEILRQNYGVTSELPMFHHLAFIVSIGNSEADISALVSAFRQLSDAYIYSPPACPLPAPPPRSALSCSPRDAFFAPTAIVPWQDAIAKVSAASICPYPPGIPILLPGEVITAEAIAYLHQILQFGAVITGGCDPQLSTFRVIQS